MTTLVTMTFVMAGLLDKSLYENSEALETKWVDPSISGIGSSYVRDW